MKNNKFIQKSKFRWLPYFILFLLLILFSVWSIFNDVNKPLLKGVVAPPFVLPEGCIPDSSLFSAGMRPKSPCFADKYLIRDWERYNFFKASGSRLLEKPYYRFYDKAVHLTCGRSGYCQVAYVHEGIFIEKVEGKK